VDVHGLFYVNVASHLLYIIVTKITTMMGTEFIKKLLKLDTKSRLIRSGAKIANGVFIGKSCYIDYKFAFLLEIKEGVVIAAGTNIIFHDSSIPNVRGKGLMKIGKIVIEKRAYVGTGSVILPGVVIGERSIVGACSLVNKNIPPDEVWGGVPIKYLCTVDELIHKRTENTNPLVKNVEYIGELEKENINYGKYSKEVIEEIKQAYSVA
jgi:maltose O-acetyltransferase